MHDLDRTSLETNGYDYEEAFEFDGEMDDDYEYEYDDEMDDEYDDEFDDEYDDEYDDEFDDEMDDEYDDEFDDEMDDEYDDEFDDEFDYEAGGNPFTPEEEAELAFELLSISSPEEEQEFFKKFFRRIGRGIKRGAKKVGRHIKRGAKRVSRFAYKRIKNRIRSIIRKRLKMIKRLAPYVGGAFGGPVGAKIGGSLSGYASKMFKMELEGLSPEDQEFEIAKRWVRFTGAAAKNALKNTGQMPTERAIRMGFKKAARRHAPGFLRPIRRKKRIRGSRQKLSQNIGRYPSGRWYRKGNKIVLVGLK